MLVDGFVFLGPTQASKSAVEEDHRWNGARVAQIEFRGNLWPGTPADQITGIDAFIFQDRLQIIDLIFKPKRRRRGKGTARFPDDHAMALHQIVYQAIPVTQPLPESVQE